MTEQDWKHRKFGLLVTGKGEEKGIAGMFRSLEATGLCSFRVLGRIGQRNPITSKKRKKQPTLKGKRISTKDEEEIGWPTKKYIQKGDCHFVILVDDLENPGDRNIAGVFDRYRDALDVGLPADQRTRAAVHFLARMMEAYFFADTKTTNEELNLDLTDHDGDVEEIRNPKVELEKHYPAYKEVKHGAAILGKLDIPHILSHPGRCGYLRALFAWCAKHVTTHAAWNDVKHPNYQLENGVQAEVTRGQ